MRLGPTPAGGRRIQGAQLKLDQHHVVAEADAQIERRFAAQEVVDLVVVEGFQRLHDRVFGALGLKEGEKGEVRSDFFSELA